MGLLVLNKGVYTHTHQLPDGTVYVHAHPYDKQSEKENTQAAHKHSITEFILLANIDLLFLTALLVFAIVRVLRSEFRVATRVEFPRLIPFGVIPGRAPPAIA